MNKSQILDSIQSKRGCNMVYHDCNAQTAKCYVRCYDFNNGCDNLDMFPDRQKALNFIMVDRYSDFVEKDGAVWRIRTGNEGEQGERVFNPEKYINPPSTIPELCRYLYEGHEITLDWSDRAPCYLRIGNTFTVLFNEDLNRVVNYTCEPEEMIEKEMCIYEEKDEEKGEYFYYNEDDEIPMRLRILIL